MWKNVFFDHFQANTKYAKQNKAVFLIFDAKKGFILFDRKTVKPNDAKKLFLGATRKMKGKVRHFFHSEKSVVIRLVSKQK